MRHLSLTAPQAAIGPLLVLVVLSGCAAISGPVPEPERVSSTAVAARKTPGYLAPGERPDGIALVPPPPAAGSPRFAVDMEVHDAMRALRETPRWTFAAMDADHKFPRAATVFACALGAPITEASMPNLYVLLQRTMVDAGQSTYAAKEKYRRSRPFAQLDEPLCVPEDVELLRRNGSYPSGHAAAGWAWALILAEIAPERTDALLQRGREFGQSRAICNVHWQSDVDTAQTIAAAVVARLHGNAEFRAQLERARKEVDRARRSAATAGVDCEAESRALELSTAP